LRRGRRVPFSLIFTAMVSWLAAIALGALGWWGAAMATALCATAVLVAVSYRTHRRGRFSRE